MTTFPSKSGAAVAPQYFRATVTWQAEQIAREQARRTSAAEEAYREACFGLLRLCFNGGRPLQIQRAAHLMELAKLEMERVR